MTTLGFVVLAKRPAPRTEHGWTYETVSAVFRDIAETEGALEFWEKIRRGDAKLIGKDNSKYDGGSVEEYVIGEIVPV